jgi:hypothetical protein
MIVVLIAGIGIGLMMTGLAVLAAGICAYVAMVEE